MADDLIVNLTANVSGAASSIEAFNARMKAATDSYNAAAARGKDIQAALADAFNKSAASGATVVEAYEQATAAIQPMIAAQEASAQAARDEAAAQAEAAASLRAASAARIATSTEMRVMAGSTFGMASAASSLISKFGALSEAASVAFPVIGLIAFGAMLEPVIVKVKDLYDDLLTLKTAEEDNAKGIALEGQQIAEAWSKTLSLTHQTGMRDNPLGTLRSDLIDANQALAEMQQRADGVRVVLGRLNAIKQSGNYLGNGTSEEEVDLDTQGNQSRLADWQSQIAEQKAKIADLQSQIAQAQSTQDKKASTAEGKTTKADNSADAKLLQQMEYGREEEIGVGEGDESQRGLLSPQADLDYWSARITAFRQGSSEYITVFRKLVSDEKGVADQERSFNQAIRARAAAVVNLKPPDDVASGMAAMHEWITRTREDLTRTGPAWREYGEQQAKSLEIAAQSAQAMQLESVSINLADGRISKLSADKQIAAIHTADYTAKIAALRAELERLQKEGSSLQPGTPEYSKNQTQQAQVQNQMSQVQGQSALSAKQDNAKIQQDIAQPYLSAYQEITTSFMQMQNSILTGHKGFAQAMRQEEQQLALFAINEAERWLMKKAEVYVIDLAHYIAGKTAKQAADTAAAAAKTTTDAAAAATTQATVTAQNVAEIMSLAAVAGAAAFASTAAIPIVGIAAAPGAAAGAYTAVASMSALAAFDVGTDYVPRTGVAMIHEGEQIVTREGNQELMNFVRSGGGSSSQTFNNEFHIHPNRSGAPDERKLARAVQARMAYKAGRRL